MRGHESSEFGIRKSVGDGPSGELRYQSGENLRRRNHSALDQRLDRAFRCADNDTPDRGRNPGAFRKLPRGRLLGRYLAHEQVDFRCASVLRQITEPRSGQIRQPLVAGPRCVSSLECA